MKSQKLDMRVEINLGVCKEFERMIEDVETELLKEVDGGKVTLFLECENDLANITDDVLKLKYEAKYINAVYAMFNYPCEAITFIEDVKEAVKHAERKKEFQENLFDMKYSEQQFLGLVVDTYRELRFSKHTLGRMEDIIGCGNQRWNGVS